MGPRRPEGETGFLWLLAGLGPWPPTYPKEAQEAPRGPKIAAGGATRGAQGVPRSAQRGPKSRQNAPKIVPRWAKSPKGPQDCPWRRHKRCPTSPRKRPKNPQSRQNGFKIAPKLLLEAPQAQEAPRVAKMAPKSPLGAKITHRHSHRGVFQCRVGGWVDARYSTLNHLSPEGWCDFQSFSGSGQDS